MRLSNLEKIYESILTEERQVASFSIGTEHNIDGGIFKVTARQNMPARVSGIMLSGPEAGKEKEYYLRDLMDKVQKNKKFQFKVGMFADDKYKLMGLISTRGLIVIQTPESNAKDIEDQYAQVTGESLKESKYYTVSSDTSKWSPQIRIKMAKTNEDLIKKIGVKYSVGSQTIDINDSSFGWLLIAEHKFKVGRNNEGERLEEIYNTIPDEYKDDFIEYMQNN